MRLAVVAIAIASLFGAAGMAGTAAAAPPLTVFAAASLTDALTRIDKLWTADGHPALRASFGSSGTLARQIEAGAPADLFLSADQKWMDVLAQKGLIVAATRSDLLGNALVLVEPTGANAPVALVRGFDIAAVIGAGGRLSVGNPASVPAGIYAREALTSLGVWDRVRDRLAPATDVRAALMQVANGATKAGIVYRSDVHGVSAVAIAGTFAPESHTPIVYPGAAMKGANATEAASYLAFLRTAPAAAIFRADGFDTLPAHN